MTGTTEPGPQDAGRPSSNGEAPGGRGAGPAPGERRAGAAAEVLVDAGAARCPMPVILAARRAVDLPAGTVLRVRSVDPASAHDVPAWCRMRGHSVLQVDAGDVVEVLLRLGG